MEKEPTLPVRRLWTRSLIWSRQSTPSSEPSRGRAAAVAASSTLRALPSQACAPCCTGRTCAATGGAGRERVHDGGRRRSHRWEWMPRWVGERFASAGHRAARSVGRVPELAHTPAHLRQSCSAAAQPATHMYSNSFPKMCGTPFGCGAPNEMPGVLKRPFFEGIVIICRGSERTGGGFSPLRAPSFSPSCASLGPKAP